MGGTSKNPSSNSGKSNGAPGAALVFVKCVYTVCQFSHDSGVTSPRPPVSHLMYQLQKWGVCVVEMGYV